MRRSHLAGFVEAYRPDARERRRETERFKCWAYDALVERAGFNLDVWADVKDESIEDTANLPPPEVIAEEIVENLTAALEQFEAVAAELRADRGGDAGGEEELLPDAEGRI